MTFGNVAAAPQLAFDSPVTLVDISGGVTTVTNIDCTNFQSLYILASPLLNALGTILISWNDLTGAVLYSTDQWAWSASDPLAVRSQIPCIGNNFNAQVSTSANSLRLRVIGSNRPVPAIRPWVLDRILLEQSGSILTGAQATIRPGLRYDGPVTIMFNCTGGAAGGTAFLNVFDEAHGPTILLRQPLTVPAANDVTYTANITLPRSTVTVRLDNSTPNTITYWLSMIAAPESV